MRGRARLVPAVVLALALTACGGDGSDAEVSTSIRTHAPASSSAAAPSTPPPPADAGAVPNERGNVPKQVGEPGGLRGSTDPEAPDVLRFAVDRFVINPECNSGVETEPIGSYLGIAMRVATTPEFDPRVPRVITELDLSVIAPDGTLITDLEGNAMTCFAQSDRLSSKRMGPGVQYSAWLVIDIPVRTGTLVYAPPGEPHGWEWQF